MDTILSESKVFMVAPTTNESTPVDPEVWKHLMKYASAAYVDAKDFVIPRWLKEGTKPDELAGLIKSADDLGAAMDQALDHGPNETDRRAVWNAHVDVWKRIHDIEGSRFPFILEKETDGTAAFPDRDQGDPDDDNLVPAGLARFVSEREASLTDGERAEREGKAVVEHWHGKFEGWKMRAYAYRSGRCVFEIVNPVGKVTVAYEANLRG